MLKRILDVKVKEVEELKTKVSLEELKAAYYFQKECKKFSKALKNEKISLIAEIKKASPSKGLIRPDFNPVEIAKTYTLEGANAISVLTDRQFFQGNIEYIKAVREVTDLPILRKDFIIDPFQIFEAKAYGADAILLIAAVLQSSKLMEFLSLAEQLGLEALVEIHTEEELKTVMDTPAKIIGINNRNLKTFETDLRTTFNLRQLITNQDIVVVSESGIKTFEDVLQLEAHKIDAMLVGETLMRNEDIRSGFNSLLGRRLA